jgi:hypothetical protein
MKALRSFQFAIAIVVEMVVVVALVGCSMPQASDFKPSKLFSLGDEDEPQKGIPIRMVGTWTDTVLTKAGQTPQRGFGGRLVFYGKNEEKPILVDGQLVVYAFDETGRAVTDNKPTRRYVFPPDQIPLHMSTSEIGASYSFWLPWDEAGGPQTEVSLICRFEPKGGGVITSEQTRHRLPGSLPPENNVADGKPPKLPEGVPSRPAQPTLESVQQSRTIDRSVQLASYESEVPAVAADATGGPSASGPTQGMTTTSIDLPAHYQFPIAAGGEPAAPTTRYSARNVRASVQGEQQVAPLPLPQPAAINVPPAAAWLPAQPTMQPIRPGFGAFPTQQPIGEAMRMPTIQSPTIGGFGATATNQPQLATHAGLSQPVSRPFSRTTVWNTVQQSPTGTLHQSQAAAPAVSQQTGIPAATTSPQQVIVQPASQPLPPATSATTTVSYSPVGASLR